MAVGAAFLGAFLARRGDNRRSSLEAAGRIRVALVEATDVIMRYTAEDYAAKVQAAVAALLRVWLLESSLLGEVRLVLDGEATTSWSTEQWYPRARTVAGAVVMATDPATSQPAVDLRARATMARLGSRGIGCFAAALTRWQSTGKLVSMEPLPEVPQGKMVSGGS